LGVRALPVAATALGLGPAVRQLTSGMTAFGLSGDVAAVPGKLDEPPPDAGEELRSSVARLGPEAWSGRSPATFIAGPDRARPEGAVALRDAIRMLISGAAEANCRFVVALDRAVVVEAISAKFEKIRGYDGNRYLEKLFPLEFHVPQPSRREADALIQE